MSKKGSNIHQRKQKFKSKQMELKKKNKLRYEERRTTIPYKKIVKWLKRSCLFKIKGKYIYIYIYI